MASTRLARPLTAAVVLFVAVFGCRTPGDAAHSSAAIPSGVAAQKAAHPAVPPGHARPATEPVHLTIAATNDLHGWIAPTQTRLSDGSVVRSGGVAALAGYLKILRAENPGGVVLLDGGDLFQGTLASNLSEGEVVIEAMNRLGYTAAAIGNHEFDYGPLGPVSVASGPDLDPFGAIKARMKQANFPLLAVNLYDAHSGARPDWLGNDGTLLVEVKGVKLGVVGLVTPSTPYTTNPVNVSSLRFGSLVPEAVEAAARLRKQGAELVVGVAHAGGKCGHFDDPTDLSSCDTHSGEVFELLQNIPAGTFDALVAGHTHAELAHTVNGIPTVETIGLGRALATIDLWWDPTTHRLLTDRTRISRNVLLCLDVDADLHSCDVRALKKKTTPVKLVAATFHGQPVVPDETLTALVDPALERVKEAQQRKLGLEVPSPMGRKYDAESALGDFLADSLRQMEKADVALLNSGGLRADLPAGQLAYGDVYEIIPFDNTIATITLTGDELLRLLHAAYGSHKGVFQVSGLKVTLGKCPGQGRLKSLTLANGKPVLPEKRYRVVVPDFLARGGDGLGPVLKSLPPGQIDLGMSRELNFRDALVAWWQKTGAPLVAPPPGRITFRESATPCHEAETAASN